MTIKLIRDDRGIITMEYAITLPVFVLLIFGIIQLGLLTWAQAGLQHGVNIAARCVSVNPTLCNNASAIGNVLSQNSYSGIIQNAYNANSLTITITKNATCAAGVTGNLVQATYTVNLMNYFFAWPLNAQSCYPS